VGFCPSLAGIPLQIACNEIGADLTSSGHTTIVGSQNPKTADSQPVVFTLTGLEWHSLSDGLG
jgi:hypothetical protein